MKVILGVIAAYAVLSIARSRFVVNCDGTINDSTCQSLNWLLGPYSTTGGQYSSRGIVSYLPGFAPKSFL
jgi:hypothetical protein